MADEDILLKDVISEIEARAGSTKKEPNVQEVLEEERVKEETLADQENKDILRMRAKWGDHILFLIEVIVCFDIVMVALYGWGFWDFKDSTIVAIIITDNFLKIIALGLIITNSLFTKIFKIGK